MASLRPPRASVDTGGIRSIIPNRTGGDSLAKSLAQSPNTVKVGADDLLPVAVVRELANSPEGRIRLKQMVGELSPRGQANLMANLAAATRDPRSPANAITLTPEGRMLMDVTFNNVDPTPQYLESIGLGQRPNVDDPVTVDNLRQEPEDLVEKDAPHAPKSDAQAE